MVKTRTFSGHFSFLGNSVFGQHNKLNNESKITNKLNNESEMTNPS